MKLDRNITNPRRGKYALIKLRQSSLGPIIGNEHHEANPARTRVDVLKSAIDFGDTASTDFFVIRLKDKYAAAALAAYAGAAMADDEQYALEVLNLARSAAHNQYKRMPD